MEELNIINLTLPVNSFKQFHIVNYPTGFPKDAATWIILGGTISLKPIDGGTGVEMSDSSPGKSVVAVTLRGAAYAILHVTTLEIFPPLKVE